eukprot:TRINITY_DN11055_c0_g1_i1.p1 TRINITY_DN11055_c0_g1~~TRINITY_DN11055_c0_g1_i1.p1  ORF type:complete len:174 (+),score=50.65 TRINITY_DN11055_c0_g1_i1:58-579(+)
MSEENKVETTEVAQPEQKEKDENKETQTENENEQKESKEDSSEEELFKMRAKLFRYDKPSEQWKERGTGDVKFMKHKETGKIRLLMRRDKVFKICANHYILPYMQLKPNVGSDRSWVWHCKDFSEEEATDETLAIRLANSENANEFKAKFEEYAKLNETAIGSGSGSTPVEPQ